MTSIEILLLLIAIPSVLLATGYGVAKYLPAVTPAERLAASVLAGLALLLWTVSVVNLALPLAGVWGAVCLVPGLIGLVRREARESLARDVVAVFFNRRGALVVGGAAGFLILLLWPLLTRLGLVFYDGTGNHDAFFWITGAEHLKRQSYLQPPLVDAVNPLYYSVTSITGWRPTWGRMGAEGLLALVSNLAGTSPLKLYVAATAALFAPWLAAVYLVARTFVVDRFSAPALLAGVLLQPMFVFFHSNANLPNLLGALMGAVTVVATARAFAAKEHRGAWLALLVLGLHGLLCSYPEMLPAIALPAAILWARGWVSIGLPVAVKVAGAALAALLINPATTLRAWNGFWCSIEAGGQAEHWPNMFATVAPAARLPAMATLSVPMAKDIEPVLGAIGCGVLLLATVLALSRARDRFGTVAILTGAGAMAVYTLQTQFGYGWQKTMQFSAVFAAAILPVGVITVLAQAREGSPFLRIGSRWMAAAVAVIFGYATAANCREAYKWSHRKYLTWDWFDARDYTRKALRNAPVLVETAGFSRPFFYTMWATYFLTESRVYFTADDSRSGGYLRSSVKKDAPERVPEPRAVLVSAHWAEQSSRPRGWSNDSVAVLIGQAEISRRRALGTIN